MTLGHLGPDPLEVVVETALRQLDAGEPVEHIETTRLDLKEEPGRRAEGGSVLPGNRQNEQAAFYLAGEMACMANTPGGGAIIIGVADDGSRVGTELDGDWLRHRIWEISKRRLTIAVREHRIVECRLLVLSVAEALEPVEHQGQLRWRVGSNCVDVDAVTWRAGMLQRIGYDWSAQPSGHTLADARPAGLDIARRYAQEARAGSGDLVRSDDEDFLIRLHLLGEDGRLTNAGSLMFVGTPHVGIDYMRRDGPGGDSTERIEGTGPLVEQVREAEQAGRAANRVTHLSGGFAHAQVRAIPLSAFREAIVNGIAHRDWASSQPTTVEHVGDTLTVTSPGGFIGGVNPHNVITHPAVPRYRSLALAMATLGLAERQGVGVDRMVRDMLAIGRPAPVISEVAGPYVQVTLLGGPPDAAVVGLVTSLVPPEAADVEALLLVEALCRRGWIDAERAAPELQRRPEVASEAISRLSDARADGEPVVVAVRGVPADHPPAARLSDAVRQRLSHRIVPMRGADGREAMILDWVRARGRVSTTEAADLAGVSVGYAGTLLKALAAAGSVAPGRPNAAGRGFFYIPSD